MADRKQRNYKEARCCGNCSNMVWPESEHGQTTCHIDRGHTSTFKVCDEHHDRDPTLDED